jgi:hypothetical protein
MALNLFTGGGDGCFHVMNFFLGRGGVLDLIQSMLYYLQQHVSENDPIDSHNISNAREREPYTELRDKQ